jgi:tripartite-type tricarboxylate transporter receptor subunit TctC
MHIRLPADLDNSVRKMIMKLEKLRAAVWHAVLGLMIATASYAVLADTAPIRLLVGFPPGGSSDAIARQLAQGMQQELGRSVVVENRSGAGGQIAAQALRAVKADGTTLFFSNSHTVSIVPVTMLNPGFDVTRDFAPVSLVTLNPDVLGVNPAVVGVDDPSMKDFVAWVKANPGRASVGVPAPGSAPELAVSVISQSQGAQMTPVPYRGDAPLVQDLIAGQIPAGIGGVGALLPYAEAGKIRIIAVNGPTRLSRLPNVPTYSELGIGGLDEMIFTAVFAPASTPTSVINQYNAAIAKVAASPEFRDRISSFGVTPTSSTPQELAVRVESSRAAYARLAKAAGFKPQ